MTPDGRINAPAPATRADAEKQLCDYSQRLADVLGNGLVGVYAHGSFARNCFCPRFSDLDVIVVLNGPVPDGALSEIQSIQAKVAFPIDATGVTQSQLRTDTVPTPLTFVTKAGTILRLPDGSRDFLLQRQDVHDVGIVMAGPPLKELFRPVPWTLLKDCLGFLFPHIVPFFKNPVLMLSRIVFALQHRRLCSKQEAGEWAAEAFDPRWFPTLKQALQEYADGTMISAIQTNDIMKFEEYCMEYLQQGLHPKRLS